MTRAAKRRLGVLAVVTLGATAALLYGRAAEALTGMELFRVEGIEVEGTHYLERDEVVAWAALPPDLSLWDDLGPLEERLAVHPLVREVRVRRRLPRTLVVVLQERQPVALYPGPVLVPVDAEGRRLPIDPAAHRLDLPLLAPGPDTRVLGPDELGVLAAEVARLAQLEPRMAASLSDAALDPWGDMELRLDPPGVVLHYRPPLTPAGLMQAARVLTDARERAPDRTITVVDLRFGGQVVVRTIPRRGGS